jgi:hypothetical protein
LPIVSPTSVRRADCRALGARGGTQRAKVARADRGRVVAAAVEAGERGHVLRASVRWPRERWRPRAIAWVRRIESRCPSQRETRGPRATPSACAVRVGRRRRCRSWEARVGHPVQRAGDSLPDRSRVEGQHLCGEGRMLWHPPFLVARGRNSNLLSSDFEKLRQRGASRGVDRDRMGVVGRTSVSGRAQRLSDRFVVMPLVMTFVRLLRRGTMPCRRSQPMVPQARARRVC